MNVCKTPPRETGRKRIPFPADPCASQRDLAAGSGAALPSRGREDQAGRSRAADCLSLLSIGNGTQIRFRHPDSFAHGRNAFTMGENDPAHAGNKAITARLLAGFATDEDRRPTGPACLGYAAGYAAGTFVGVSIEQAVAYGWATVRIVSRAAGVEIAEGLRDVGHGVTEFSGFGVHDDPWSTSDLQRGS